MNQLQVKRGWKIHKIPESIKTITNQNGPKQGAAGFNTDYCTANSNINSALIQPCTCPVPGNPCVSWLPSDIQVSPASPLKVLAHPTYSPQASSFNSHSRRPSEEYEKCLFRSLCSCLLKNDTWYLHFGQAPFSPMLPPNITEEKCSSALQQVRNSFYPPCASQYISDISQSKSWCLCGGHLQKHAWVTAHFQREKC